MASRHPAAVVFDCDGVLVDSEPASTSAWMAALIELGHPGNAGELAAFIGRTDLEIARHYAAELELDPSTVDAIARRHFDRIARSGLTAFADAAETLDWLSTRRMPMAVASNSSRWRLDAVLAASGLSGRIRITVAGDEVSTPKPAPDVYLAAVDRLQVDAADCVCLEDSPAGIEAARAAGLRVVAIDRGAFDRRQLSAADAIVERITPTHLGFASAIPDPQPGASDR